MEHLFIKNFKNPSLFLKCPSIDIQGIFDYNPEKETIISFTTSQETEEFEIINKDDDKDFNELISKLKDEKSRIIKLLELLIVNIDIQKVQLPHFKIYNYENIANHMKTKIKKHSNNNYFDIIKFNLKNGINKDKELIIETIKQMSNIDINKDDIKLAIYFILIKIINLFDCYLKCIHYSIELLNDEPSIIKNENFKDFIINLDNTYFNFIDDEININHHNLIKNSYAKNIDKNKSSMSITSSTIIKLKKNSNKNYEIYFK
jgi:hypothetical protein